MAVIRGVIFDLGHTLMYLDGDWEEIEAQGVADMREFLAEQGLALDPATFGQAFLARRQEGYARAMKTRTEVLATGTGPRFWPPAPCAQPWLLLTIPTWTIS